MLLEVVNFLPKELFRNLVDIAESKEIVWQNQKGQEGMNRLSYSGDLLQSCKDWLSQLPIFKNYRLKRCQLWKDGSDFFMTEHVDNDDVEISLQIYLNNNKSPGTEFQGREIEYGENKGYILYNQEPKIPHRVKNTTPHEGRLSLYALFEKKREEQMKALLIGSGSKWGQEFTNFLLSKNYKVDLITGSDVEERLNLKIYKVNWKNFTSNELITLTETLSKDHYDLIFFNQNSQMYPVEKTFSQELDISKDNWTQGFWIDCQMPYYLIKRLNCQISKNTRIGWMLTGLITSQQKEYWKYGGYISNKNTNLHLMRSFSQYHPGIFFCIDPFSLKNYSKDSEDIFNIIQNISEDDNGKIFTKDGKESNFYKLHGN